MKGQEPSAFDVNRVIATARLARIDLDPARLPAFVRDVNRILAFFEAVRALPPSDDRALGTVHSIPVRRPDEPAPGLGLDQVERLAPAFCRGHFRVPPLWSED